MHTKIDSEIWTDEDFDGLEGPEKLAALWLMTRCDVFGWLPVSQRVYEFQTRQPLGTLEGACAKMPRTFRRLERGVLVATYIRRQFGSGPALCKSALYTSLLKKMKLLPEEVVSEILELYPELKGSPQAPSRVPLGTKEKEKEKDKHKEKEKEIGGVGGAGPDWEEVMLCTAIRDAYAAVRRDSPQQVLDIIRDKVALGNDAQAMLAGTRECARRYLAKFPPGTRSRYANSAVQFFSRDLWNDPDAFADKLEGPAGSAEKKEGGGATARLSGNLDLEEPSCDWRAVLREVYPPEQYPGADYDMPWSKYEPGMRAAVVARCRQLGLLPVMGRA